MFFLFFFKVWFVLFFSYVGRLFVKSTGKPIEILTKLNELAGFAPDQEIELFEVCAYQYLFLYCCDHLLVKIRHLMRSIHLAFEILIYTFIRYIFVSNLLLGNQIWAFCHVWTSWQKGFISDQPGLHSSSLLFPGAF